MLQASYSQSILVDSATNFFQNTTANKYWTHFSDKIFQLKSLEKGQVTIIHLGDSHIQGGYLTRSIRELFNTEYGASSRGWVFPFSIVNSNGAEDVIFYSNAKWNFIKYNKVNPFHKTNISGYTLYSNDSIINLTLSLRQNSRTLYPFNELALYYQNSPAEINCMMGHSQETKEIYPDIIETKLKFNTLIDSVSLQIKHVKNNYQLLGINLSQDKTGIIYHEMGINGIGYETFDKMINFIPFITMLKPDCIIISLGTNDAYMRLVDTPEVKRHIESVIKTIKSSLPETCIILTTVGDYLYHKNSENPNIIIINDAIEAIAKQEQCVTWDFFRVMGGLGSSRNWSHNGLFYKDMLHLSKEGYLVQGELFYHAFEKTLEQSLNGQ